MSIRKLLQNAPLYPEDVACLVAAYERPSLELDLTGGDNAVTRTVAKKIIEIGQTGVRYPEQISELAIKAFREL